MQQPAQRSRRADVPDAAVTAAASTRRTAVTTVLAVSGPANDGGPRPDAVQRKRMHMQQHMDRLVCAVRRDEMQRLPAQHVQMSGGHHSVPSYVGRLPDVRRRQMPYMWIQNHMRLRGLRDGRI